MRGGGVSVGFDVTRYPDAGRSDLAVVFRVQNGAFVARDVVVPRRSGRVLVLDS